MIVSFNQPIGIQRDYECVIHSLSSHSAIEEVIEASEHQADHHLPHDATSSFWFTGHPYIWLDNSPAAVFDVTGQRGCYRSLSALISSITSTGLQTSHCHRYGGAYATFFDLHRSSSVISLANPGSAARSTRLCLVSSRSSCSPRKRSYFSTIRF